LHHDHFVIGTLHLQAEMSGLLKISNSVPNHREAVDLAGRIQIQIRKRLLRSARKTLKSFGNVFWNKSSGSAFVIAHLGLRAKGGNHPDDLAQAQPFDGTDTS